MSYSHQDFTVHPHHNGARTPSDLFQVKCAGSIVMTTTKLRKDAERLAHELNLDPWFFDRK